MKKLSILILAIMLTASLMGGEALSLEDAYSLALKNNYSIRQIRNSTEMTQLSATAGNAGLLPSVSASAGVNYSDNSNTGTAVQSTTSSASLNASYLFFDGLGNIYTYKKLKSQSSQAEVSQQGDIETTLLLVTQAFLNATIAQDDLEAAEEQVNISKETFEKQKINYEMGNSNKLNYLNYQVNLNLDEVSYLSAKQSYEEQKRTLNVLLGRDPESSFTILPYIKDFMEFNISEISMMALEHNPDVNSIKMSLDQSKLDLKISKAAYSPKLSLSGSYGLSQTVPDLNLNISNPDPSLSMGLNLSWDLFTGRRNTQTQLSKIAVKNSQLALESTELSLLQSVQNACSAYKNSLAILEKQTENLAATQLNFDQTSDYFDEGLVTSTQFREAQLNLLNAKINISQARNTVYLYQFQILQLTGQLLNHEGLDAQK